jgi:hypothetical protein
MPSYSIEGVMPALLRLQFLAGPAQSVVCDCRFCQQPFLSFIYERCRDVVSLRCVAIFDKNFCQSFPELGGTLSTSDEKMKWKELALSLDFV